MGLPNKEIFKVIVAAPECVHINDFLSAHPGQCTLSLNVVDHQENIQVSLQSRTLKVSPVNTFLRALEAMDGVSCKVA